ncbi:low molecular weight phosphotyrosine protein phosphatase [Taibaiella lutea]|uniref:protein-tyrosine-phosphatase n=2 Tax=Taibaiella lutea TaxID=2608001 RepID=A0A5M6CX93_9BACT|nr:low molecular weight phosphotyrosine protein phosphatase [Taibaiella lutea]
MVCLGNICRSPIAEGIMKNMIQINHLNWMVDSAGTESYHVGEPPHPYSQKICQKYHVDISQQKARQFVVEDFKLFDKIYCMSKDVMNIVKHQAGSSFDENKVSLFLNELYPSENRSVPDPWYGEEEDYVIVYDLINKTCEKIVAKYKSELF